MWERYPGRTHRHLRKWTKRHTCYVEMPTNNMSFKKIKVVEGSVPMQGQAETNLHLKHNPESRRNCMQGKCILWSKKHKEKKCPKWQCRILDQLFLLPGKIWLVNSKLSWGANVPWSFFFFSITHLLWIISLSWTGLRLASHLLPKPPKICKSR